MNIDHSEYSNAITWFYNILISLFHIKSPIVNMENMIIDFFTTHSKFHSWIIFDFHIITTHELKIAKQYNIVNSENYPGLYQYVYNRNVHYIKLIFNIILLKYNSNPKLLKLISMSFFKNFNYLITNKINLLLMSHTM